MEDFKFNVDKEEKKFEMCQLLDKTYFNSLYRTIKDSY